MLMRLVAPLAAAALLVYTTAVGAPDPDPRPAPAPPRPAASCSSAPADMACVPGGTFRMGSLVGDADEQPVRPVTVGAFLLDKYEVSFGLYMQCVEAGRCAAPRYYPPESQRKVLDERSQTIQRMPRARAVAGDRRRGEPETRPRPGPARVQVKIATLLVDADLPVAGITWFDARDYCAFVQKHLPTEAQWELAARGSSATFYPWGSETPDCNRANTEDCGNSPMSVTSLPGGASPQGVLNLTGNVWEWVNDWYDGRYYATAPTATDPIGPINSQDPGTGSWAYRYRVVRGGSWSGIPAELHSSYRYRLLPSMYSNDIGFRCARSGLALDATAPTQAPLPAAEPPPPIPGASLPAPRPLPRIARLVPGF